MITYLMFILFFTQGMWAADLNHLAFAASCASEERQINTISSMQTAQEIVPYLAGGEYIQSSVDGSRWELWQGQVSPQTPMGMNPAFSYGSQGMSVGTQVMPMRHSNVTEKSRLEFVVRASQQRGWPIAQHFKNVIDCCLFETIHEEALLIQHKREIEVMLYTLPIEQRDGIHYTRLVTKSNQLRCAIELKRTAINRTMDHINRAIYYLNEYPYPPSEAAMYFDHAQIRGFGGGQFNFVENPMANQGQLGNLSGGGL